MHDCIPALSNLTLKIVKDPSLLQGTEKHTNGRWAGGGGRGETSIFEKLCTVCPLQSGIMVVYAVSDLGALISVG